MKRTLLLALLFHLGVAAAASGVRYVNDDLTITLRRGEGSSYQILKTLHSGAKLQVLKSDGVYTQVRAADGTEGWVRTQYLTAQPIARDRLAAMTQRVAQLQQKNAELETAAKQRDALSAENGKLKAQVAKLEKLVAAPLKLKHENQQLREKMATVQEESRQLQTLNTSLRDDSNRRWFVAGGGVLVAGILLGLLLPLLRRKRSGWGDL